MAAAVILYVTRLVIFQLEAPHYLTAIESCSWIFAVLGFGSRYLNHPGKTLSYLSKAAYPVYILHMIFLYLGSALIMPLEIHVTLKFILVVMVTGIGCFGFYELIIRRIRFIGILFGLKPTPRKNSGAVNQSRVLYST